MVTTPPASPVSLENRQSQSGVASFAVNPQRAAELAAEFGLWSRAPANRSPWPGGIDGGLDKWRQAGVSRRS
jgi:hypothetical protein